MEPAFQPRRSVRIFSDNEFEVAHLAVALDEIAEKLVKSSAERKV